MIPIITLNDKGQINGQQAFNDNLTAVEQINRVMVATLFAVQQALTNDKNKLDQIINKGEYTEAQLTKYAEAVNTLHVSLHDALKTFETAIEA